jgi:hypothetical protein
MRHAWRLIIALAIAMPIPGVSAQEDSASEPHPPAQLTLPPNFPGAADRSPDAQPNECDLKASPDYVAGIDARGREVVPADLPSGQKVDIGTEVFVETAARNRQLPRTGVLVNLPGLGAPACVPLDEKSRP